MSDDQTTDSRLTIYTEGFSLRAKTLFVDQAGGANPLTAHDFAVALVTAGFNLMEDVYGVEGRREFGQSVRRLAECQTEPVERH